MWNLTKKFLEAEFLQADAQMLHNVCQLSGTHHRRKAAKYAKKPFINVVKRLVSDPYVLNDAKKAWREKSQELAPTAPLPLPLPFLQHLAWLFLRIFCVCQSCRKRYEDKVGNDDRNGDYETIQRIEIKSQDARSRRMEANTIFFLIFLVTLSPIWIFYWSIYLVRTQMIVLVLIFMYSFY